MFSFCLVYDSYFFSLSDTQLPYGMKEKKKYKVDQPLKRINWNKIQATRLKENSFWVNANDEKFASDDVFQILIDNFSTKPAKSSWILFI